jgi:hypothetical protein
MIAQYRRLQNSFVCAAYVELFFFPAYILLFHLNLDDFVCRFPCSRFDVFEQFDFSVISNSFASQVKDKNVWSYLS